MQLWKLGFERAINCNIYQPKVAVQEQNQYFDFLIGPIFEAINRLFVLSFENNDGRTSYTRYYSPLIETKEYNVLIDG